MIEIAKLKPLDTLDGSYVATNDIYTESYANKALSGLTTIMSK
jgi:hypothetical protein